MPTRSHSKPAAGGCCLSEFSAAVLARTLVDHLGLTPHTPLHVAYSGGIDSHVLLHALAEARRTEAWPLSAIHVDHGLNPKSAQWARHCIRVCAELAVPCRVERVVVSGVRQYGVEAAARRARYDCFARCLNPNEVLMTAHHEDDQAETLLLQLLRGSGVRGLAAMPDLAKFGAGFLARPMLGFSRESLKRYADLHKLEWIEDASNADIRIGRNFLRQRVLPVLAQHWPRASKGIARSARHAGGASEILDEIGRSDLQECASVLPEELSISALVRLSPGRIDNVLRYWIRTRDLPVPSTAQFRGILRQLRRPMPSKHARISWPGAEVRLYRDRLSAERVDVLDKQRPENPNWYSSWDFRDPLYVPAARAWLHARTAVGTGLARARTAGRSIEVRLRRGGEVCRLPRRPLRPLKKILQEEGIPPWERVRIPLVFIDGNLAAIGDRWVCEPYDAHGAEPAWVFALEKRPETE